MQNVVRVLEGEKEKAVAEVHDKFDEIIKQHGSEMRRKAVFEFHFLCMGLRAAMASWKEVSGSQLTWIPEGDKAL